MCDCAGKRVGSWRQCCSRRPLVGCANECFDRRRWKHVGNYSIFEFGQHLIRKRRELVYESGKRARFCGGSEDTTRHSADRCLNAQRHVIEILLLPSLDRQSLSRNVLRAAAAAAVAGFAVVNSNAPPTAPPAAAPT